MPPPRDADPTPELGDQTEAFSSSDLDSQLQKPQATYFCQRCGSNRLTGIQPTVDTKNRWAIASRCLACKRTNVIAVRD